MRNYYIFSGHPALKGVALTEIMESLASDLALPLGRTIG